MNIPPPDILPCFLILLQHFLVSLLASKSSQMSGVSSSSYGVSSKTSVSNIISFTGWPKLFSEEIRTIRTIFEKKNLYNPYIFLNKSVHIKKIRTIFEKIRTISTIFEKKTPAIRTFKKKKTPPTLPSATNDVPSNNLYSW